MPGLPDETFGHDYGCEASDGEVDLLVDDCSESEYDSNDSLIHEGRAIELG